MQRIRFALAAALSVTGAGVCSPQAQGSDGVIAIAPHAPTRIAPGQTALGIGSERDGFLFVPHDTSSQAGVPLLVLLHGATQRARLFERMLPAADSLGVAILAPDSRDMTWDAVRGEFGVDVAFLQQA